MDVRNCSTMQSLTIGPLAFKSSHMSFLFDCPHCGTKTEVDDQYSGRAGECVTCGKPIQLPRFAASSVADRVDSPTAGSSSSRVRTWKGIGGLSPARLAGGSVLLMLLIGFGYLVFRFGGSTLQQIQNNQNRVASMNNLQTIAKALDAYAEIHGSYPPAHTVDAQGMPLHSWRVLILPFLNEVELYDGIDLDLPWDSARNQPFHYNVPSVYTHPNFAGLPSTTPYQLLVGKQGVFRGDTSIGPDQVIDEPGKTILVAEIEPNGFTRSWMEPTDINMDRLMIDTSAFWSEVEGLDTDGVMVATVDGRVHVLPKQTSVITVDALFTPRGREPLSDDVIDSVLGTQ